MIKEKVWKNKYFRFFCLETQKEQVFPPFFNVFNFYESLRYSFFIFDY
jgi:hypothetical protein